MHWIAPSEKDTCTANITLTAASEGPESELRTHRSVDLLGRVYEYFLTRFASAEGKNGGQFYTPSCVVRCLVESVPVRKDLAPYKGRIYDPACGSDGMFVQSEKFVESHGGKHPFNFENAVNFSLN